MQTEIAPEKQLPSLSGLVTTSLFIDYSLGTGFSATSQFDSCFPAKPLTFNRNRFFIGLLYILGIQNLISKCNCLMNYCSHVIIMRVELVTYSTSEVKLSNRRPIKGPSTSHAQP